DGPIAVNDSASTTANKPVVISVLDNDIPGEDPIDSTSVMIIRTPENGLGTVNSEGTITYDPNMDFVGLDSLVYQVCDTSNVCDTAFIYISVLPFTDTLEVVEVIEDTPTEICGDTTMIPGDIASVDVCDPSNGTATVDGLTGCVLYTPNPGYIGTDELCIIVWDGEGTCDTTIVPIDVVPMGPVTDTSEIVEVIEDT